MKSLWDAVVIGGGPAGSFFAFEAASHGLKTVVFEEHETVGVPAHCAGHLSIQSLRNLDVYPLPNGIVENIFANANIYSPKGTKFSIHLSQPVTCAVNRALFDSYLADKAKASGVDFRLGQRVHSLSIEKGYVKGVNLSRRNGKEEQVTSHIVVDAEGISSRFLHQAGLRAFKRNGLVYAIEADVENVKDVEDNAVEVYLGKDYAPGFYGWLIPRLDGTAKVGLATQMGNPKEYFERLKNRHPIASEQLRNACVRQMTFHSITLGGLVSKAYWNGFLAVGDCASQVKPTTGGGVIFSLICARIAAKVASTALNKADVSSKSLQSYQECIRKAIGFDMKVMLTARKAINSLSDDKIDRALQFVGKVGLEGALRNVKDIDLQGRALLATLKKPSALATVVYLLALCLPANP